MSKQTKSGKKYNVTVVSFENDSRFGEGSFVSMKLRTEELQKLAEIDENSRFILRRGKTKDGNPVLGKFSGEPVYFLEVMQPYEKKEEL